LKFSAQYGSINYAFFPQKKEVKTLESLKKFIKILLVVAMVVLIVYFGAMMLDNTGSNRAKVSVKAPAFLKGKYKLAMSDEFTGRKVNKKIWNFDIGSGFPGETGIQYYSKSGYDIYTQDGTLILTAHQNKTGTHRYVSSRIQTRSKVQFRYGYIEARIKMQDKNGYSPQFKLLGVGADWSKQKDESKASGSEIIIMRHDRQGRLSYGLVWTKGKKKKTVTDLQSTLPSSLKNLDVTKWHRYGIFWNDKKITWYIDRKPVHTEKLNKTDRNNFRRIHYVMFNTEIEADGSGTARAASDRMTVDYMRIFQVK
jgi:beta-glucanase (GH16 family)